MDTEPDCEQIKSVDATPSVSSEDIGRKRAHPDDGDEDRNEKKPRLDGEESKVENENVTEESAKAESTVLETESQIDFEAKAAPNIETESVSQPRDNADKIEDASQNKEALGEEGEKVDNDIVMKDEESQDSEDKAKSSKTESSVAGEEKSERKPEDSEAKEHVADSGSGAGDDTPVSDASKAIQNGGVANQNGLDDRATVKSDDSEKENQGRETPMDLTRKPPGPTDVITLSDESDEEDVRCAAVPNGYQELSSEEQLSRARLVKRLQAELRNEEAKLVLLKKLRHSQMTTPQLPDQAANSMGKTSHGSGSAHRQSSGPPPLVRGQQQQQVKMAPHFSQSQSMRSQHSSQSSRSQMHGPPPLVMARGGSNSSSSSHLLQQQQQQQQQQQHSQNSQRSNMLPHMYSGMQQPVQAHQTAAQVAAQDTQTPAQRQAAAKLALRKQLEKTLLQIPPPKPPPPEMNFIPSLACPDFILLLGLEEVVNYIIDAQLIAKGEKNADEKFVCNPFTCVQCHSDYTPVWKREKPGSKNVICEQCVTSNQKKALKQEHTNRLKSAFVKALQQEQEIERMQAQSLANTPPAPAMASTPPMPSVAASSPMMPAVAPQYKPSHAEQLRQHQNFLQAHQAQFQRVAAGQQMGMSPFGPRGHYPYQIPYSKQSELQRQYLLDMIPRGSMQGWKS